MVYLWRPNISSIMVQLCIPYFIVKTIERYQSILDPLSWEHLVLWQCMWLWNYQCGCTDLVLAPEPSLAVQDNSFHVSDITRLIRLPLRLLYPGNDWVRRSIGNSSKEIAHNLRIYVCHNESLIDWPHWRYWNVTGWTSFDTTVMQPLTLSDTDIHRACHASRPRFLTDWSCYLNSTGCRRS